MARCEDFPACGHEMGCCPRFDQDTGKQLDMVCTCGARIPVTSRFSICAGCLRRDDDGDCLGDDGGMETFDCEDSGYGYEDSGYDDPDLDGFDVLRGEDWS